MVMVIVIVIVIDGTSAPMDQLFAAGLFADQVVLITGGGTGIGRAVAEETGRLGAKLVLCGRRQEKLDTARGELEALGIEVLAQSCDTRKEEQIAELVGAALARFGRIDVLVNNAGGQFPTAAQHLAPKGFEAVVRNNLLGTWNMTHAVAGRAFIPQRSGRIVNVIAQIARGFPGMVHTGAARAGVENLTKSLAVEWAQHGIRVNAVAPGVIKTSGTEQYPPMLLEAGRRATPLKRLGRADEVSHLITYLASRAADFVTGQTFYIDGGQSLWGDMFAIADDVPGGESP
jgi:NAD(P)-dependent dehydrogenase (short-subunit alcohol dehydrogenase family)